MDDLIQKVLSRIDYTETCWIWQFSLDRHGYGQLMLQGKNRRVHRLIYELLIGEIPHGLDLDHLCRNRACVNPSHLEPVTRSVNLLRGELWQSKKTHCPKGHSYDFTDTYGRRRCRKCTRAIALRGYYRRKVSA